MRHFSSIKSSLKTLTLLRGSLIAALGGLLILIGGIYLTPETLRQWGLLIFFVSFGLIALGLIPYRRLTRLEDNPYELQETDEGLSFFVRGQKMYTIPHGAIAKLAYCQKGLRYGIGVWLKEKVVVHERRFDMAYQQMRARRAFGCDLFLPFFTERTLRAIIATHE